MDHFKSALLLKKGWTFPSSPGLLTKVILLKPSCGDRSGAPLPARTCRLLTRHVRNQNRSVGGLRGCSLPDEKNRPFPCTVPHEKTRRIRWNRRQKVLSALIGNHVISASMERTLLPPQAREHGITGCRHPYEQCSAQKKMTVSIQFKKTLDLLYIDVVFYCIQPSMKTSRTPSTRQKHNHKK